MAKISPQLIQFKNQPASYHFHLYILNQKQHFQNIRNMKLHFNIILFKVYFSQQIFLYIKLTYRMIQSKYKIILIGDVRVGKTSFLYSATGRSQNNIQPTMGIEFMSTSVMLHGKQIKIEIWDTTGAQTYRSITSTYYKKAHGVILMFDIGNKSSFDNVKRWNSEVDQKARESISKILIGNKLDLVQEGKAERQVNEQQITNFCIQNHMTYKETSALKGTYVKQALVEIIEKIHQSGNDSHPGNQYTSFLQNYPNTTILLQPPIIPENQTSNSACPKCC